MNDLFEFFMAALPWLSIGLLFAIFAVRKTCLFCTAVLEKLKFADIFVKNLSISKGLV